jgi:hypothetical protein
LARWTSQAATYWSDHGGALAYLAAHGVHRAKVFGRCESEPGEEIGFASGDDAQSAVAGLMGFRCV